MIPDRLLGWWMASVAGTAAVLLFSPRSAGGNQLRAAASKLAATLADELDAVLRGEPPDDYLAAAMEAPSATCWRASRRPRSGRPVWPSTDQALANCFSCSSGARR